LRKKAASSPTLETALRSGSPPFRSLPVFFASFSRKSRGLVQSLILEKHQPIRELVQSLILQK
jgi:hypothetical protein